MNTVTLPRTLNLGCWTLILALAQAATGAPAYTVVQVTAGAVDHRAPSINNNGEILWMAPVSGQGLQIISSTRGQLTTPNGPYSEAQYPSLADDGTFLCFRPGSLPCTGSGYLLRYPGEATVEFCSRNGSSHRDPIRNSAISSDGKVLSGREFYSFGFLSTRRFFVNGAQVSQGDYVTWNNPAINAAGEYVYEEFGSIYSSTRGFLVNGRDPAINDRGDVAYETGGQIKVLLASYETIAVAFGSAPSINKNGVVVFESLLPGTYQIFQATPRATVDVAVTRIDWSPCAANATVQYRIMDAAASPSDNVVLEVYWASGPSMADVIGPAGTNPRTPIAGAPALYEVYMSTLGTPPPGATHLLALADADSQLNATPDGNDLFPLALIDLEAAGLDFDAGGGVRIQYGVGQDLLPGVNPVANLYWAGLDSVDSRIEPPIVTLPVASSRGCYGSIAVDAALLQTRPAGAQYLVLALDLPANVLAEGNERNNVRPLLAPIPPTVEVLVPQNGLKSHPTDVTKQHYYTVEVRVQNNDPVNSLTVSLDLEEIYSLPRPSEDARKETFVLSVGPAATSVRTFTFRHSWEWIPRTFTIFGSEEAYDVAMDLVEEARDELAENVLKAIKDGLQYIPDIIDIPLKIADIYTELAQADGMAVRDVQVQYKASARYAIGLPPTTEVSGIALSVPDNYQQEFGIFLNNLTVARSATALAVESGFKPVLWPLIPGALVTEAIAVGIAKQAYGLAVDPPDSAFTEIAVPEPLILPELDGLEDNLATKLARAYQALYPVMVARAIALNRADGASLANAPEWESRQLLAAAQYAATEAALHSDILALLVQMEPMAVEAAREHGDKVVPYLMQNGLPDIEKSVLRRIGWSTQDIDALTRNLINAGPRVTDRQTDVARAAQTAALQVAGVGRRAQERAIKIRTDILGVVPRGLTVRELEALEMEVTLLEGMINGGGMDDTLRLRIGRFESEVRRLVEETSNVSELRRYEQRAAAFLAVVQQRIAEPESSPLQVGVVTLPATSFIVGASMDVQTTFVPMGNATTYTAMWVWGDGTTTEGVIKEGIGVMTVEGSHTYTFPGLYEVTAIVRNQVGGEGASAPITVRVVARGDIDGDGVINRTDLAVITSALNKQASGPYDLRDLDRDGRITVLDARILVTLFTRPGGR